MKNRKGSKAIAATPKMVEKNFLAQTVPSKKMLQEIFVLFSVVLGLGIWIKACLNMEESIFLQKALVCSFIIISGLFLRRKIY